MALSVLAALVRFRLGALPNTLRQKRTARRWYLASGNTALEAHRCAGHKPQARMMARRVRPRLPDGRPRQGEGQAGLLPVLFGEEEAREADKARLTLGPSARKEWGEAGRRLLPIGVFLRILDWTAMRGGYGVCIVFDDWIYAYVDVDAKNRPIGNLPQWDDLLTDSEAVFRSWFIANDGRHELQKP